MEFEKETSTSRVMRRLLKDWKEIQENLLPNVAASPLEENMLQWHVNIRGPTKPFSDSSFHLIMEFPETYPIDPPKVNLCTSLPHPNVFKGKYGKDNHICLDMLGDGEFANQKGVPNSGWSSSYSVLSLLTQLQAFLMEDSLMYATNKVSLDEAIKEADNFKCKSCPHKGTKNAWPKFLDIKKVKPPKKIVKIPNVKITSSPKPPSTPTVQPKLALAAAPVKSSTTSIPLAAKVAQLAAPKVQVSAPTVATPKVTPAPKVEVKQTPPPAVEKPKPKEEIPAKPAEPEWTVVKGKKKNTQGNFKKPKKSNSSAKAVLSMPKEKNPYISIPVEEIKEKEVPKIVKEEKIDSGKTLGDYVEMLKQTKSTKGEKEQKKKEKTSKKNAARAAKRKALKAAKQAESSIVTQPEKQANKPEKKKESEKTFEPAKKQESEKKSEPTKKQESEKKAPEPEKKKQEKKTPKEVPKKQKEAPVKVGKQEEEGEWEEVHKHSNKEVEEEVQQHVGGGRSHVIGEDLSTDHLHMGKFDIIPYEVIVEIMTYLSTNDVHAMELTCRATDGYLWKTLFGKYYPHSQLTPENMKDWRYLFMLELHNIVHELVCFHTKNTFEEDVLGIPLEFTINPKTKEVDYIYSSMDIISSEAYHQDKVRLTVWKEKFTHWLPLYITEDHFQRALPYIKKTLVQLSPQYSSGFVPQMAIEVIPKLMNTMIVLISDKGVHASMKTLDGYFALHRLLIGLIKEFPQLQNMIDKKISDFIKDENSRNKNTMRSLGDFLPLVSVSQRFSWPQIAKAYLSENFDRNVIWIGKKYPSLPITNLERGKGADNDRLSKSWEATHVSMKLLMFHVYFLWMTKGKSLEEISASYDLFYGRPSNRQRIAFQDHVKKIIAVNSWPDFFKLIYYKAPSPAELTDWLKESCSNSKKKKYHSDATNFSSIQASGVSKILLKGETYSASPTLAKVKFEDSWSWPTDQGVTFLDASALLYGFDNKYIGMVDWSHTTFQGMRHSGDVMDHSKSSGKHTIVIDLKEIPSNSKALYFTLSAYSRDLKYIKQPWIRFTDADLDMELCRYNLESVETGTHTCVIMCKLWRNDVKGNWQVLAVGHIGEGRATTGGYDPIKADIAALEAKGLNAK